MLNSYIFVIRKQNATRNCNVLFKFLYFGFLAPPNEYQPTFGSNLFKSMVLIVHKLAGIGADKTMNYDERKKLFWYFAKAED